MRIGEFARKHNITHDAIRHYLDMGLLVTEKKGGHYRFDENDSWDLEKIIELKKMDFSLAEIQELLCYHRLAGDMNVEYRKYYLSVLQDKKKNFQDEIRKYKEMETIINNKIVEFESDEDDIFKLGLPLSFMEILSCPYCDSVMEIVNGAIEKNMIMTGKIKCTCGFMAIIENGMYIDEEAVKEKRVNGKKMLSKKEFLDIASPKFINFYYNGMAKSIDYILKYAEKPRYILELDNCAGSFLMQYIKKLDENSIYILLCHDKERLTNIKSNIESLYSHSKIVFLCCDIERMPIRKSTIDLVIDHGMTKVYDQLNHGTLSNIYSPLVKKDGILIGTYHYFNGEANGSGGLSTNLKEAYNKEKNFKKLKDAGLDTLETMDIGPITEDNPYNLEIKNKELYMTIYAGINKGKETSG